MHTPCGNAPRQKAEPALAEHLEVLGGLVCVWRVFAPRVGLIVDATGWLCDGTAACETRSDKRSESTCATGEVCERRSI